ncbi:MAG: MFS transporter [Lentilactobacillus diolivorans]|jgi:fucose permease|nr:MFS transporter [Lentilactobacillus diolivorans]
MQKQNDQQRRLPRRGKPLIPKMVVLLMVMYIVDVSLGLPDSLLGSGWPKMHLDLNVPLSYAGFVTMIIALNTIFSSLSSNMVTTKFGAGVVTLVSILLTTVGMLGFSISSQFWMLCLWAIPYGLGAGAIDAATNNFVALNYDSRQLNWLNSFYSVGTIISPYIMGSCLSTSAGWHLGYIIAGSIQMTIALIVFASLPLWKNTRQVKPINHQTKRRLTNWQMMKIPGMRTALITFFAYSTVEQTAGLWASTYMVRVHGISLATAAKFGSLFYIGITLGRFFAGVISDRIGDQWLVRTGCIVIFIGIAMISMPISNDHFAIIGLITIGLGCAPIWPAILHATPINFGADKSQIVIGIQMAAAYTGTTTMPPLFGWLASHFGMKLFPVFLLGFAVAVLIASERLARVARGTVM